MTPDPALRIRYYHPDHLGSSSAITDAAGTLIEETAFHPSGVPRHEHQLRSIEERYTFTGKVVGALGKGTTVISVGMKAIDFARDRSEANGAQLLNEGAKTLMSVAVAPVGLIWSLADLAGVGPSQLLDSTYKTIEAHKESTAAYQRATESYRGMTKMINEAAPRIAAQQQHVKERLKVLNQKTAKLQQTARKALKGDTRSLAELNAAIKAQERANARTAGQLRRELVHLRKVQGK
jgi:hypothetical protein